MMRLFLLIFILTFDAAAFAQSAPKSGFDRVQLNDVDIQGEANSDGMRFSQRQTHDINERLKLRTDFMDRVEELVPPTWPQAAPDKSLTATATAPAR